MSKIQKDCPKPVDFEESNKTYTKPSSWGEDKVCGDLPTYQGDDQIVSCWYVGWGDRLRLLFSGKVWVSIVGSHQPPLYIVVRTPFAKVKQVSDRKILRAMNGLNTSSFTDRHEELVNKLGIERHELSYTRFGDLTQRYYERKRK